MKKALTLILALTFTFETIPLIPLKEAIAVPQRIDKKFQDASDWFSAQDASRRAGSSADAVDHQNDIWSLIEDQISEGAQPEEDTNNGQPTEEAPKHETLISPIATLPVERVTKHCLEIYSNVVGGESRNFLVLK